MPTAKVKRAHFVIKEEYYRAIASGEKTSEFRYASPYWIDRLDNSVKEVTLQLGYGSAGYPPRRMRFRVAGVFIHDTLNKVVIPYPRSVDEIPDGFRACLIEIKLGERLL